MSAGRSAAPDFQSRSPMHRPSESRRRASADGAWVSREVDAMAAAWSRGRRVLAAEIIDRNPEIDDEAAVRLIYEEVNLRREAGEDVRTTEVVGRYARWKDELEVLLGCDRMLRPLAAPAEVPEVGEHLGPFYLKAELGRGASGRTYLATEPTLADRPVVLKVISDDQEEHLSLARLQHTNIIPLFSEHSFPERRLRALCMPYLGGASLARVLEAISPIPPADRRGRDILHVLDRVQVAGPAPATADGPYRRNIENVSYVDAICWIGTRLADALQEAHAHGLVHMDVKPSNVLIAADGSPMLLDFHLASRPLAAGEFFPGRVGGTPGWMAPEQRAALDAVAGGEPIPAPVDHRADLYALGLLLREALGGPGPDGGAPLRSCNPEVSVGLQDILARCLAIRPADRYPTAAAVAEDLRRHLEHEPLRGVPNRSPRERWRKWRRRRPSALGFWAICISSACLALIAAGAWGLFTQQEEEMLAGLKEGRALCQLDRYADAEHPLRRALDRAEMLPGHGRLAEELRAQMSVAHRGQRAEVLHKLAEQVRFRYGIDPPAGAEAQALLRNVRTIWDDRRLLFASDSSPLAPKIEDQIRADLLELVATWADVKARLASPAEAPAAREEALAMLEEARSACGPSFTIDRLRRSLADQLGRATAATEEETAPSTASDHYDLARSLLREGQFAAAAEQFRLSLDQRPQDYWPNFYLGLCEFRLGRFDAAVSAFAICIALDESKRAEGYFNRAMAAEALGRIDQALDDYGKALKSNPTLTSARINRGILYYKSGRLDEAIEDLRRALQTAADAKTRCRINYNLALVHLRRGDRASARAHADQAIETGDEEAWDLRDRLRREHDGPASKPGR